MFKSCKTVVTQDNVETNEVIEMNKTDLVNAVATKSELTKADASKAVDALLETISSTLGEGEKFS